jgi:hypothetical protein
MLCRCCKQIVPWVGSPVVDGVPTRIPHQEPPPRPRGRGAQLLAHEVVALGIDVDDAEVAPDRGERQQDLHNCLARSGCAQEQRHDRPPAGNWDANQLPLPVDLRAGGDLAQRARDRLGPMTPIRRWCGWRKLRTGQWVTSQGVVIGFSQRAPGAALSRRPGREAPRALVRCRAEASSTWGMRLPDSRAVAAVCRPWPRVSLCAHRGKPVPARSEGWSRSTGAPRGRRGLLL